MRHALDLSCAAMTGSLKRQKTILAGLPKAAAAWTKPAVFVIGFAFAISAGPGLAQANSAGSGPDELTFREFFALPVGPRGLEPTERLLALQGRTVRLRGFAAQWTDPPAGLILLAPVPVHLGDEDESFADDLPASTVYVHLSEQATVEVPARQGRIAVVGRLDVGPKSEADGRVSFVRLWLDAPATQAVIHQFQLASETPHAP